MTAIILLIICVVAQILIAVGLGIYLFRRFSRERREKQQKDLKP
jgi:flagellar basal body-associated protein FliL